ncbi:Hypothetical predicted protein [Pelobates cultripes]|nr:Hypothetical predicted protein [Pelobates cultripes]
MKMSHQESSTKAICDFDVSGGSRMICTERYGSGFSQRYFHGKNGALVCEREGGQKTYGSLKDIFVSLFLPHGFPYSVSEDYLEYQLWDTLQAFASSVTGSLATHSLLRGSGVGDSTASVTAATITWILRGTPVHTGRFANTYFIYCSCERSYRVLFILQLSNSLSLTVSPALSHLLYLFSISCNFFLL